MDRDEFKTLQLIPGRYMRYKLNQLSEEENEELLKECIAETGDKSWGVADASVFILKVI